MFGFFYGKFQKFPKMHLGVQVSKTLGRLIVQTFTTELKVGQMTRTIWVTWVTFLVGQVGLTCKLNYLDVTQIFNRVFPQDAFTCFVSEWSPCTFINVLVSNHIIKLVNTGTSTCYSTLDRWTIGNKHGGLNRRQTHLHAGSKIIYRK